MSPIRVCVSAGCGNLTRGSRCDECERRKAGSVAEERKRREPWRYLYGLRKWQEAREAARKRAGYRCEECGEEELVGKRALDVHHKIKLRDLWQRAGGGTPRFDQGLFERAAFRGDRLRYLCDPCHGRLELEANVNGDDRLWT